MKQTESMTKVKRGFYAAMGTFCILLSLAILSKILRDLFMGTELGYGKIGLVIQHPAIQALHVVAAVAVWTGVFLLGFNWLIRAKTGRETVAVRS
ncbi:MAG: hypothetical protein KF789_10990 [Bdellovibrionaceae bacterium]|nr:hypothetical protein [Pseudobdellovibrionaceae bacterium]